MTPHTVPDALFTDALSGMDGTGDPPPPVWRPEVFPDALVAPGPDLADSDLPGSVELPRVPVPQVPVMTPPAAEDWNRDLNLPAARGSSAERAEAARRAAAARRDAAVASRGAGGSPAPRAKRAKVQPAAGRPYPMPAGPLAARRPAVTAPRSPGSPTAVAPNQAVWAPPMTGARPGRPSAIAPARSRTASAQPGAVRPRQYGQAHQAGGPAQRPSTHRRSGGAWAAIVFLIVILVGSGLGQRILDALSNLFQ